MADDSRIFVGNKPFLNYVSGVVMQFTTEGASEVVIRARGKFISRAVDVAEVACKRFLTGVVETKKVSISSGSFTNQEGKLVRVSTIDILLGKIV